MAQMEWHLCLSVRNISQAIVAVGKLSMLLKLIQKVAEISMENRGGDNFLFIQLKEILYYS